jgi:hypothetical protein
MATIKRRLARKEKMPPDARCDDPPTVFLGIKDD